MRAITVKSDNTTLLSVCWALMNKRSFKQRYYLQESDNSVVFILLDKNYNKIKQIERAVM